MTTAKRDVQQLGINEYEVQYAKFMFEVKRFIHEESKAADKELLMAYDIRRRKGMDAASAYSIATSVKHVYQVERYCDEFERTYLPLFEAGKIRDEKIQNEKYRQNQANAYFERLRGLAQDEDKINDMMLELIIA